MEPDLLSTLFEHFTWARNRLLNAAQPLTPEQLRAPQTGAFGSIYDTLTHMAASEWMWMQRIHGNSPQQIPGPDEFAELAALRAWWDAAHAESMAYLGAMTPDEMVRAVSYRNTTGREFHRRVWQMLLHIATHQAEHRAQVAAMLTGYGVEAPPTDLVVFLPQG